MSMFRGVIAYFHLCLLQSFFPIFQFQFEKYHKSHLFFTSLDSHKFCDNIFWKTALRATRSFQISKWFPVEMLAFYNLIKFFISHKRVEYKFKEVFGLAETCTHSKDRGKNNSAPVIDLHKIYNRNLNMKSLYEVNWPQTAHDKLKLTSKMETTINSNNFRIGLFYYMFLINTISAIILIDRFSSCTYYGIGGDCHIYEYT